MGEGTELATSPPPRAGRRDWRRAWRHARRRIARRLVRALGPFLVASLERTWRFTVIGPENLSSGLARSKGLVVALWHGRMLLGLPRHASRGWWVLVSGSQDGDISAALLRGFGYRVIRGSSSRDGVRAARMMLSATDEAKVIILTPDGPKGPRHSIAPGLAWVAGMTGYPVLPIGFACDRAWRMRSWDRFTIPKPWSRVVMVYGAPVQLSGKTGEEARAEAASAIRGALLEAESRALAHLGLERDW